MPMFLPWSCHLWSGTAIPCIPTPSFFLFTSAVMTPYMVKAWAISWASVKTTQYTKSAGLWALQWEDLRSGWRHSLTRTKSSNSSLYQPYLSIPYSTALGLEEIPKECSPPTLEPMQHRPPGSCPVVPQAGSPYTNWPAHSAILRSAGPAVARSHSRVAAEWEVKKLTH